MNKKFRKKEINCKLKKVTENCDKNLQNHFCVSRGYPVTQFQALKNSLAHRPHRSIGNNFLFKFQTSKNRNSLY